MKAKYRAFQADEESDKKINDFLCGFGDKIRNVIMSVTPVVSFPAENLDNPTAQAAFLERMANVPSEDFFEIEDSVVHVVVLFEG